MLLKIVLSHFCEIRFFTAVTYTESSVNKLCYYPRQHIIYRVVYPELNNFNRHPSILTNTFVRCTTEQYCCKFVYDYCYYYISFFFSFSSFFFFLSANCRAQQYQRKKAITSRACYFFKEMTVYRVHSYVHALGV